MKNFLVIIAIIFTACGGSLTDDQRKRIKDEMASSKIQRVSEAEIAEAAFSRGRKIVGIMLSDNPGQIDSVQRTNSKSVMFLRRDEKTRGLDSEIMQAYIASEGSTVLEDNIQPIRSADGITDSILYTYPVTDSVDKRKIFQGMWSIRMSKKELILSMKDRSK
jgi:hypothetical protein